ncbi:MAG: hypothetical protein PHO94_00050 [Petrimonas sp.]|nr:hypothetical protein [Petrimonas sp.]
MDKTIEIPFFKAFEFGGVVHNCIDYFRHKYDLGYYPQEKDKIIDEKWQNFYDKVLPERILKATEEFDDSVIIYADSPLIEEIEKNLCECQSEQEKERYLFSLLKPFNEISKIYCPTAEINRLNKEIQNCENEKKEWMSLPMDKVLFNTSGEPAGTPKEQIEACDEFIIRYKNNIERIYFINRRFIEITNQQINEKNTVEHCLEMFVHIKFLFTNRLDALLLTYGIDLMKLQQDSGFYLKSHRMITDVDWYIGSMELAQKYINDLKIKESAKVENNTKNNQNSNNMECGRLIMDAYFEYEGQRTPFKSFFKREAQKAQRDEFTDPEDLLNGCLFVLSKYKSEIENQYNKRYRENDFVVASIETGKGIKIDGEIITDTSDNRIIKTLEDIARDKEFVKSQGYKNNNYPCYVTSNGSINEFLAFLDEDPLKLFWPKIEEIEQGVLKAKEELSSTSESDTRREEPFSNSFKDFFIRQDIEKIDSITEMMKTELNTSRSKALTLALYTVALQKKGYISKQLNQTKYHQAVSKLFGTKSGTRANFSEKFSEVNDDQYQNQLNDILKRLP